MDVFKDNSSLEKTLKKFQALKQAGFTCFNQCTELTKQNKKAMTELLKSFFKKAKNKQSMEAIFLRRR